MTFRTTARKLDDYIVDRGATPFYIHEDTGIRIRMKKRFKVMDMKDYANTYFREEGFSSAESLLSYVNELYRREVTSGYAHVFEVTRKRRGRSGNK